MMVGIWGISAAEIMPRVTLEVYQSHSVRVEVPNSVTDLNQSPLFEWCVGSLVDHLMSTRIFALIMNKIFIRVLNDSDLLIILYC